MIKVIPAVDISRGKCVRLTRGRIEEPTVYYDDPLDAASRWVEEGADILHLIDLDAAVEVGENTEQIKRVIKGISIPVEVGGGIRSLEKAKDYMEAGAERVIFGTAALELRNIRDALEVLRPMKVMAAVDHLMGRVAVRGWKELTEIDTLTLCTRLEEIGIRNIMMTSIDRDGTMKGPNLEYSLKAAADLKSDVYLAGGFTTLKDLYALRGSKIAGVIIGKALYEGSIELKKAMEVLK
jgi:phosphoribosylformimino-5-aminoimidazole carboxamide ribotide isomerase